MRNATVGCVRTEGIACMPYEEVYECTFKSTECTVGEAVVVPGRMVRSIHEAVYSMAANMFEVSECVV